MTKNLGVPSAQQSLVNRGKVQIFMWKKKRGTNVLVEKLLKRGERNVVGSQMMSVFFFLGRRRRRGRKRERKRN